MDGTSTPNRRASHLLALAQRRRTDAGRVAALAVRGGERGHHRRRRRIARGADRKVDDATRELVSHVGQRVEPVVGIRRRDEARLLERHQDGTSREVNTAQRVREPAGLPAKVVSRTTYSARRPTDGRLNRARTRIRVVVHARQDFASRWSAARTSPRSYGTTSLTTSARPQAVEMAVSRSSNLDR